MTTVSSYPVATRQAGTISPARHKVGVLGTALPLIFLMIWVTSLSHSLFDPIGYDQALYQYMAERVIAGDILYEDVWDQNAPGIVLIHWISTQLIGRTPVAHRLFDALWQAATLLVLILLGRRSGRPSVGWLAAIVYTLGYYGMGYVHTAQREGFAVLPILLSVHLILASRNRRPATQFFFNGLAGGLGLFIFAIKPPLGLCYGYLWLRAGGKWWQDRRQRSAWIGLTAGFLATAVLAVGWLKSIGAWDGCWGVLSRRDMPGYIAGPQQIREILPVLMAGSILIATISLFLSRREAPAPSGASGKDSDRSAFRRLQLLILDPGVIRFILSGWIVFGLLLTATQWPTWQKLLFLLPGLWLPAIGAILLRSWRQQDSLWQISAGLLVATTGALILQGQFFLYHCPPIFAMAALLVAVELDHALLRNPGGQATNEGNRAAGLRPHSPIWTAVLIAATVHLLVGYWYRTMTFPTAQPYVLAGTTLPDHYDAITKHKRSCPRYSTTAQVADRIQALTGPDDPIACLFHDMRIYYFSRRPSVYKLLPVQPIFAHYFPELMHAIDRRRPKVIAVRVPESLRSSSSSSTDLQTIETAIFNETEKTFGPEAAVIRQHYRLTERIDDVGLLQPTEQTQQ